MRYIKEVLIKDNIASFNDFILTRNLNIIDIYALIVD